MATDVLDKISLDSGAHSSPEKGFCVMEAVSILAGEPFGDGPPCTDGPLRRAAIRLNDRATDEQRQLLRPFIPRMIGTAEDGHTQARRLIAANSLMTALPKWMRAAKCDEIAEKIEQCGELTTIEELEQLRPLLREARDAARAARSAAYDGYRSRIRAKVIDELKSRGVEGADAAAVVAVDAAVDAVAVADADIDLTKVSIGNTKYWKLYDAVYKALRETREELTAEVLKKLDLPETPEEVFTRGLNLLDAMCKVGEDERQTPDLHWEELAKYAKVA